MKQISVFATIALFGVLSMPLARAQEANPHNGYAFWLPNGTLTPGDAAGQQAFTFERTTSPPNGEGRTTTTDTFIVPLRKTRFDTPERGNLVIVIERAARATVYAGPSGSMPIPRIGAARPDAASESAAAVYGIPRKAGDPPPKITVVSAAGNQSAPRRYRFYFTDDADVFAVDRTQPHSLPVFYGAGVAEFFRGNLRAARSLFQMAESRAKTPEQARYARRFIRWCNAQQQFGKIARRDGRGFYDLGLYSMVNGFWELAEKSFRAATEATPRDPDAWYMLGDATSYVISDTDNHIDTILPYYRKAADLYPRRNSNTYRNRLGLFHNLRVLNADGSSTVLHLTREQIADTKRKWEFCTAVMEAASRGALRFDNQWAEYEQEFDNTAPMGHDPAPFEGLWEPGTVDTFMKFTGWGASDAIGADCGPSRSASVNIGMREWDVLLHEWNHTLDWLMIFSGVGYGVPTTHSSDWCGFQPISSMGMGHHSCNRYYMTPGMYRIIHGSDRPTTPWVSDWLISPSNPLEFRFPDPVTDASIEQAKRVAHEVDSPLSAANVPQAGSVWSPVTATDGYVDLKALRPDAARNAWTWAHVYVYSPKDQKARAWIGADDNARVWVNNAPAYNGIYWSVCKWEEAREKDQIATVFPLKRGWNSVLMQVSNVLRIRPADNPPHPFYYGRPDAWGFSLRLCDTQNRALPGVRFQANRPDGFDASRLTPAPALQWVDGAPKTFRWNAVKDDYTQDLPHLSVEDLRAVTRYDGLTVTDDILLDPGAPSDTPRLRTARADASEVALNNQLNWFFSPKEMVAMLRYTAPDGQARDLVLLRPEMYEAFTRLATVAPEAKVRGVNAHADQVIGYFTVPRPDSPHGRIVLVLNTYLGDNPPTDEEDLLGFGAGG